MGRKKWGVKVSRNDGWPIYGWFQIICFEVFHSYLGKDSHFWRAASFSKKLLVQPPTVMNEDFWLEGWFEKRWKTESWEVGGWAVGKPGSGCWGHVFFFLLIFWSFQHGRMASQTKFPSIFELSIFGKVQAKNFGVATRRNGSWDAMPVRCGTDFGIWDFLSVNSPEKRRRSSYPWLVSSDLYNTLDIWPSTSGVVTTKRLVVSPLTVRFPIPTHMQLACRKKFQ